MAGMNDTVAVALITSLSTLCAAALASAVSAAVTGRQLRYQDALAREERKERRAIDYREMRREAYERFLAQTDAAYRVLDEGWFASPFEGLPRWEAGFTARRALDEAFIRVQLVGPGEVAELGAGMIRSIGDEFRSVTRIIKSHPSTTSSAAQLDPRIRAEALQVRFASSGDFVTTARQAIGAAFDSNPRADT